jgi:hypothetical protein
MGARTGHCLTQEFVLGNAFQAFNRLYDTSLRRMEDQVKVL